MNRTKKVFLLLLITMITCFSMLFAGCGTSVEGTYKFKKLRLEDGKYSAEIEIGDKYEGMKLTEDFFVITINEDGRALITMQMYGEDEIAEIGSWVKGDGDKMAMEVDGSTILGICDGKKIEFEYDGVIIILEKQ